MEMLSGAQMVVRALEDQGVEHVFGYPGGSVLDIYDALFENGKMEHVLVRHEQAAVHMADGYARSTGKVGTVLVTSGPGATNCITGIATAYMDSIPLVILSGQVPTSMIGEDAFQETDMIGISRPVVKHSFLCKKASDIPEAIKKAYYIAASGRPGPVVVDLPKDVQNPKEKFPYQYPETVSLRSYNPTKSGHKGQIKRAAKLLVEAQRPVMYVGGGAINANADHLVTKLAELLNLPVTTTLMGLGAFSGVHPQFIGMLGMHGTFEANKTMHNADLIFAVGARFDDRVTNNVAKFCPNATVVHIDIDPTSISKTVQAHVPIVGSVETVLEQMLEVIRECGFDNDKEALADWWSQINQWRSRHCLAYEKSATQIKPQQVIETLYKVTQGQAFVASDVGQHQMFAALYYPFAKPRQWINSGGPRHHGLRHSCRHGGPVCQPGCGGLLRHRRWLGADEHSGALHLHAVRRAHQDHLHQQPCAGHGQAVAEDVLRRPSQPLLHGVPAGLRQTGGSLWPCRHRGERSGGAGERHGEGLRHEGSAGVHGYLGRPG